MSVRRVYITGASGTGTTSVGASLATALDLQHIDTDAHFWWPTDPPFTHRRKPAERRASLLAAISQKGWVISGSCEEWGLDILEEADLVVFLTASRSERLRRLRKREHERFGARIAPEGDMYEVYRSFLDWAMSYDDGGVQGRSWHRQEAWLLQQPAPVLRLRAEQPYESLIAALLDAIRPSAPSNQPSF